MASESRPPRRNWLRFAVGADRRMLIADRFPDWLRFAIRCCIEPIAFKYLNKERCNLSVMRFVLLLAAATSLLAQNNSLTPAEKAAGFKLLFDGKTFNGWVDPAKKSPSGDAWSIDGDAIKARPDPRITEDL